MKLLLPNKVVAPEQCAVISLGALIFRIFNRHVILEHSTSDAMIRSVICISVVCYKYKLWDLFFFFSFYACLVGVVLICFQARSFELKRAGRGVVLCTASLASEYIRR